MLIEVISQTPTAVHREIGATGLVKGKGRRWQRRRVDDRSRTALVGMRQKKYVDDVIGSLKAEKIKNAEEIWENIKI